MVYLEIALATSFILFLASSLVSGINEIAALLLNKRSRELQRALSLAFPELDDEMLRNLYSHPLIAPYKEKPKWGSVRNLGLYVINWFRARKYRHEFLPSYLDSKVFAHALADILILGDDLIQSTADFNDEHRHFYAVLESLDPNSYGMLQTIYPKPPANDVLKSAYEEILEAVSPKDFSKRKAEVLEKLRKEMRGSLKLDETEKEKALFRQYLLRSGAEVPTTSGFLIRESRDFKEWITNTSKWYDTYMDRVSGWYKKRAHTNIFWWSVAFVVLLDFNILEVIGELYRNQGLRELMVENATNLQDMEAAKTELSKTYDQIYGFLSPGMPCDIAASLPGWLVTIFAVSLGAPFWFDALGKLARLRASGKPANEPDDKKSA